MRSQNFTEVFVWGDDQNGQLGLGQNITGHVQAIPQSCTFGITIRKVSCGDLFAAMIDDAANLYTMGSNVHGRLGIGPGVNSINSPTLVESVQKLKARDVSCGEGFGLMMAEKGTVYSWGSGQTGALGLSTLETQYHPVQVNLPKIRAISAGTSHSIVITTSGKAISWGQGAHGQFDNSKVQNHLKLHEINLPKLLSAEAGNNISIFLSEKGQVYTSGFSRKRSSSPELISDLNGFRITKVACDAHFAAISATNELFIWGRGAFGEFFGPQKVNIQIGVTDVAVGGSFACLIDTQGDLYTWGDNQYAELGLGDVNPRSAPTLALSGRNITSVYAGSRFGIALGGTYGNNPPPVSPPILQPAASPYTHHSALSSISPNPQNPMTSSYNITSPQYTWPLRTSHLMAHSRSPISMHSQLLTNDLNGSDSFISACDNQMNDIRTEIENLKEGQLHELQDMLKFLYNKQKGYEDQNEDTLNQLALQVQATNDADNKLQAAQEEIKDKNKQIEELKHALKLQVESSNDAIEKLQSAVDLMEDNKEEIDDLNHKLITHDTHIQDQNSLIKTFQEEVTLGEDKFAHHDTILNNMIEQWKQKYEDSKQENLALWDRIEEAESKNKELLLSLERGVTDQARDYRSRLELSGTFGPGLSDNASPKPKVSKSLREQKKVSFDMNDPTTSTSLSSLQIPRIGLSEKYKAEIDARVEDDITKEGTKSERLMSQTLSRYVQKRLPQSNLNRSRQEISQRIQELSHY